MPREKRSPEELRAASNHLFYELWMLQCTADGLALQLFGQSPVTNALLESFTVHARVLLSFVHPGKKPRDDDVIADDYFDDCAAWYRARPDESLVLVGLHHRVGKEIAHLTYARQSITEEAKQWHFLEIAREIANMVTQFVVLVPKDLLGDRWDQALGRSNKPAGNDPVFEILPVDHTNFGRSTAGSA